MNQQVHTPYNYMFSKCKRQSYKSETTNKKQLTQQLMIKKIIATQKINNTVKILVLGNQRSGKTTFMKQCKLLYQSPFTSDERLQYKQAVFKNIVESTKYLLDKFTGQFIISAQQSKMQLIKNCDIQQPITDQIIDAINIIFQNVEFQQFSQQESLPNDNYNNMIRRLNVIKTQPPNDSTILLSYKKSTDIQQTSVVYKQIKYIFIDVPAEQLEEVIKSQGQDICLILYVASLTEYDNVDEHQRNSMKESIKKFGDLINSSIFTNTPIVLCVNKQDALQDKLQYSTFRNHINNYTNDNSLKNIVEFVQKQYEVQNKANIKSRLFKVYTTNAINTSQSKEVLESIMQLIQDQVLSQNKDVVTI